MEIVLVVGAITLAYVLGYRRGRRASSTVEMSARDLKRALKNARK